jgi:hypothetical protein
MGSGAVIYVPSFIKFGSGVQKIMRGDTHRDTQTDGRYFLIRPLRWAQVP